MNQVAFTAPHHHAAEIGLAFLQQGAHSVDAMIAAAAAISVAYPHMNSIGGDGFWLIHAPGEKPVAIDACGYAGQHYALANYAGQPAIPSRGIEACITMGGTIAGWQKAREHMSRNVVTNAPGTDRYSLSELLSPAVQLARSGIKVSESLHRASDKLRTELIAPNIDTSHACLDFQQLFIPNQLPLQPGQTLCNPALADTFEQLAHAGLRDFYEGDLATETLRYMCDKGSRFSPQDFSDYQALEVSPLEKQIRFGTLYNLPLPTQGLVSLLILAIYDALYEPSWTEEQSVHTLIEATKLAFDVRDRVVGDPSRASEATSVLLGDEYCRSLAQQVRSQAAAWPKPAVTGDTIWMGACDKNGVMVSFIQSVYWEFGAAVMNPTTGVIWNNRGSSFSLDVNHHNHLAPRMKPFHTLNPAFFLADSGERMVYGTMGGEGQPQTQAALFARALYHQMPLQQAISKGRWLLGRTWGAKNVNLNMEQDIFTEIGEALEKRGHTILTHPEKTEMFGHAGAIWYEGDGTLQSVTDPRSDGAAFVEGVSSSQ